MALNTNSHRFCVSFLTLISMILLLASSAAAKLEDHITKTESGFYYTVQKGDTLWDLSKQFSDSPWQWPDLWSHNPQIANPHRIYPGQKILIFKKEWEGRERQAAEPAPLPVEQPLPPKIEKKEKYYTCLGIDGVGFIRKEAVPEVGVIFKSDNDISLVSSEDKIYIRPASSASALAVGDQYVVYRVIGPIKDRDTLQEIGYQHLICGIVTITRSEPKYAIAKVGRVFRELKVNDLLMPYEPRSTEIAFKENIKGLTAKLIKPEEEDSTLIAQDEYIFFDKGSNDGVEPGQSYFIYEQEEAYIDPAVRMPDTLAPEYVGTLFVLRAEPTASTGYIINSMKPINVDNIVGDLEAH